MHQKYIPPPFFSLSLTLSLSLLFFVNLNRQFKVKVIKARNSLNLINLRVSSWVVLFFSISFNRWPELRDRINIVSQIIDWLVLTLPGNNPVISKYH